MYIGTAQLADFARFPCGRFAGLSLGLHHPIALMFTTVIDCVTTRVEVSRSHAKAASCRLLEGLVRVPNNPSTHCRAGLNTLGEMHRCRICKITRLRAPKAGLALGCVAIFGFSQQLAQHKLQDATALVILDFVHGIDATG